MAVQSATADAAVIKGVEDLIACGIELVRTQTALVEDALEPLRSKKFRAKVVKLLAKVGLTLDQALARILADPAGAAKLIVKAIFSGRKSEAVAVKLLAVEAAAGGGPPLCNASQGSLAAVIDGVQFVADRVLARVDRSRGTGQVSFATINGSSGSGPGARFLNFDFPAGAARRGQSPIVRAMSEGRSPGPVTGGGREWGEGGSAPGPRPPAAAFPPGSPWRSSRGSGSCGPGGIT